MTSPQHVANPFALLMDPDSVIRAMEKSERLENLHRRICRPLDRPLLPKKGDESGAVELDEDLAVAEVEADAEVDDEVQG